MKVSPGGSLLSCSPLAPLSLPLLPLAPYGQTRLVVYYTICRGPHHLCGGKGQDGSEREQGEWERSMGSERGARGAREEWEGVRQGGPTTSVGARGKMGARGSKGSDREWERSKREQDRGSPQPLWGQGARWEQERSERERGEWDECYTRF